MLENGKLWGKPYGNIEDKIIVDPQKYFVLKNVGIGIQNMHVQI